MSHRTRLPSPAMVIACLALAVSLAGTGYATVVNVPRASVGTPELKRNAVKPSKIAPNAVRSGHVLNGSLLVQDFRPGQLPQGPKGERGERGPAGPAGPVGISGYEIVRASGIVPANTTLSAVQAECPSGKRVLGGAASVQTVPGGVFLHTSHTAAGARQFYDVHAVNTTAVPRQVNAIAFCANVAE